MTLSDTDLEVRLRRDLRAQRDAVAPAPRDLAEATRRRHRVLRRREYAVGAAALAAAVLLVGVPVVASTVTADPDRGQTAGPGTETGDPRDQPLFTTPTRGGLADDEDWLDAVAALSWWEGLPHRDPGMEFGPEAQSRHVAYADDVPSGRVALVVGISAREVVHAWFIGPEGASPSQMTVAASPHMYGSDVAGLVDGEPDADTVTLVVVAQPDDYIERPLVPTVDAEGVVSRGTEVLDLNDGIAVVEVDRRWAESDNVLSVHERGFQTGIDLTASTRLDLAEWARVEPADPRGLTRGSELNPFVTEYTGQQLRFYGLHPDEAEPTLLAWGTLGAYRSAAMVGVTFPSGATGIWVTTYDPRNPDQGSVTGELAPHPAGTDPLDRIVAVSEGVELVPEQRGLVVSAPDGVRADVLDASGAVLERLPLTEGSGVGPLSHPDAAVSVRIVDESGATVGETLILNV